MGDWNGKVRCFNDDNGFGFTKNKVYKVINGTIINDKGVKQPYSYKEGRKYENIDELNEDLCLMFEEIFTPKLCEILDVEVDEKFKVSGEDLTFRINSNGDLVSDALVVNYPEIAVDLINGKKKIIKLPFYQFNEDEIIILKGLWLNGYKYIVRDKCGDGLWAYDGKPTQYSDFYDHSEETDYSVSLNDDFFKNVTFGNMLDISLTLSKID